MRWILILVMVGAVGGGGWYGYNSWLAPSEVVRYTTDTVTRGTIVSTVSATGTVEPLVTVLVGSQVSGTVMHLMADFNDRVEEGMVLAQLDQDRFKAVLAQRTAAVAVAKARVDEAQAHLATAQLEHRRIERAFERQAASDFELESRRADESAAQASVNAAEAQFEAAVADQQQAQIELDKTIIRSPIDGVVISRNVDEGQTVAASLQAPTLFTIANDLTKMRVNAAVSEMDIGVVREGMEADFRVDAYPSRRFRGRVSEVRYAQTVVDNVVTYTTLIDVDNPELLLRPGMTAVILFEVQKSEDVLTVPNTALRFDPQAQRQEVDWRNPGVGRPMQPRVFKKVGEELTEVPVEIGLTDGRRTEIHCDQLDDGDEVVVGQEIITDRGRSISIRNMLGR
ncbi:MAG: efflux RND transporter periplasmic adaptor subunit [Phycisphaerae bacterium]|nr:efflux RND transporter periplasmic adaptor subunit [Phycisphaerae bacterium]